MQIPKGSPQSQLMAQLTEGTIEPKEFLHKVLSLDQLTGQHEQASLNELLLTDSFVRELCTKQDSGLYWNALSVTYCHLGQVSALFDTNQSLAYSYFSKAYNTCLKLPHEDWAKDWTNYMSATFAYFSKDLKGIESSLKQMDDKDINTKIVRNLLKGLIQRGYIDYQRDYSNKD